MRPAATDTPQVLLAHHLRKLKLPTFQREFDKLARGAAKEGLDHPSYLLRRAALELIDRARRIVERRIRAATFPAVKSLDTIDLAALPALNKPVVLALAHSNSSSHGKTSTRSATPEPEKAISP